jgi:transposase
MADLTDAQWERLAPLIPVPPRRPDGKGRPRVDNRAILNGIVWVLCSGARWKDLPDRYPPYQTCHRRFQEWIDQGVFKRTGTAGFLRLVHVWEPKPGIIRCWTGLGPQCFGSRRPARLFGSTLESHEKILKPLWD